MGYKPGIYIQGIVQGVSDLPEMLRVGDSCITNQVAL